jgi:two-component system chemotaxis sensor kinase CheA
VKTLPSAKNPTLTSPNPPSDKPFVNVQSSPLDLTIQAVREVARDTARRLGKEIDFHFSGEAPGWVTADFSRVQAALIQAVRNAIDHGIESKAVREKKGKSPIGQIWLDFTESGEETVIQIRDDGAGIDFGAVRRKAIGLGLVPATARPTPRETFALLFEPGFSTKNKATEVSGRGVGLDIVLSVTDSFSGKVEIDTTRGKGCTLTLRLPRRNRALVA